MLESLGALGSPRQIRLAILAGLAPDARQMEGADAALAGSAPGANRHFELGQVFQHLLRRPRQLDLAAVVLENEALNGIATIRPNVEKPADLRRIITEGLSQAPFRVICKVKRSPGNGGRRRPSWPPRRLLMRNV
jgi:hypothetical protein